MTDMFEKFKSFENDVKTYGTQATISDVPKITVFENDVKTYGTQAGNKWNGNNLGLRMM